MDITETCAPISDQINADALIGGPTTITVVSVTAGSAEQPINVVTEEFGAGRPYKPSKAMRRILLKAWGSEASAWTGRRITIYRDPEITFGRDKVGGIRISNLSHIDKRIEVALTVARGKRAMFIVEPLPDAPPKAAAGGLSPDARKKWLAAMFAALNEATCKDRDDQLTVITELAGRQANPPEHRDGITDDELKQVVNRMNEAKQDEKLGAMVNDILNTAALKEAEANA